MKIFKPHQALDYITQYLPEQPIIIEAGAYKGKDTLKMAHYWPQGTIHAFEPVPELFTILQRTVANQHNVHCHQLALSDTVGSATIYLSEKPTKPGLASQANSLLKPKERLSLSPLIFPRTATVPTTTLDAFAYEKKISTIDFLWLDMQGYELNVLQAAPQTLKNVRALFTEVGFVEGYENQPTYRQVERWLSAQGFKAVARDFEDQERWFFGNVLFVRM